jgi:hypothetical protein
MYRAPEAGIEPARPYEQVAETWYAPRSDAVHSHIEDRSKTPDFAPAFVRICSNCSSLTGMHFSRHENPHSRAHSLQGRLFGFWPNLPLLHL